MEKVHLVDIGKYGHPTVSFEVRKENSYVLIFFSVSNFVEKNDHSLDEWERATDRAEEAARSWAEANDLEVCDFYRESPED